MTDSGTFVDRVEGDIVLVQASGYVNGAVGEEIAARCEQLMDKGHRQFVVDLSAAKDVNSMAISSIFSILEKASTHGGQLVFCGLSRGLTKTFDIMGLTAYCSLHLDQGEALAALADAHEDLATPPDGQA